MDIQVERAFSMAADVGKGYIFCGCADGVLRIFNLETLEHMQTITKPPPLGTTNIETGMKKIKVDKDHKSKYADVLSVQVDAARQRFLLVYSDNMVILWDYNDMKKIHVMRTFLAHCGPIYDICKIPEEFTIGLQTANKESQAL